MMNQELEALARRAVACKGWRWMAGMRVARPKVFGRVLDEGAPFIVARFDGPTVDGGGLYDGLIPPDMLPDLEDPATLGCLPALLRDVWGLPDIHTVPHDDDGTVWTVEHAGGPLTMPLPFEAALISALESAP